MKNEHPKKILIFTTSTEKNGTAKLRDTVEAEIPDHFKAIRSYTEFFTTLLFKRNSFRAIFPLSNLHFMVAVSLSNFLRIKVPIVLGMYHPNQWKVYATDKVSKTRHYYFKELCKVLTHDNIIHSSKEGVEATNYYCNINTGTPTILQGPAEILPLKKQFLANSSGTIKIVTIGRLVDFKVCTITAMISALESLALTHNTAITYDIYGDGPSRAVLEKRISQSPLQHKIKLHSFVPKQEYLETVIKYDLFFGMAGALILAASAGVPSLIAIQQETAAVSYGFICDYDQENNPVFGDPSRFATARALAESIVYLNSLNTDEKTALGKKCAAATYSYSTVSTRERLLAKIENAKRIKGLKVPITGLIKIFYEVKKASAKGILDEHT